MIRFNVFGAGFALYEMGSGATALGNSITAFPIDVSILYYNPAGISFLNSNSVMAGVQLILPQSKFAPAMPIPGGDINETESQIFNPIHFYFNYKVNPKLSIGAGLFNPFGLGMDWKNKDTFIGRFVCYYVNLEFFDFAFDVSYKITDNLSFGGGIDLFKGSVDLDRNVTLYPHNLNSEAGKIELSGQSGIVPSFNVGIFYKIDKLNVGLSYRHGANIKFDDGDAKFFYFDNVAGRILQNMYGDQKVNTEIDLPSLLSVGLAYEVFDKLTVSGSFNYVTWSSFDKLVIDFQKDPIDTEVIENYNDVFNIRLGCQYILTDLVTLRFGYMYDQTPQPVESMSPLLGDGNRNDFSFGIEYKFAKNMSVSFNYMSVIFGERNTLKNGKPAQYDGLDAAYHSYVDIFGVSYNYNF